MRAITAAAAHHATPGISFGCRSARLLRAVSGYLSPLLSGSLIVYLYLNSFSKQWAAFAGFVFLSIYLNAKLKVWANYHPAMWKLIAIYAPILGATLIAGALTIDEYHNWYDCLAGAIIGTIMAFSSYRMVYCSLWDWRTNHIPLNRGIPIDFSGNAGSVVGEHSVFTNKAGWGGHGADVSHSNGHGLGHSNGHGIASGYHGNGVGNGHDANALGGNGEYSHSVGRKPVGGSHGHHVRGGSDNIV